jgi:site-specific DNA-methyltransferase (adenine-specific)
MGAGDLQEQVGGLPRPEPVDTLTEVLDHESCRLYRGDCLEFLHALPPGSVDLIVTDPAYSGMNQHMQFGHGRIVGNRKDPDCEKWFEEFQDDPETFLVFLQACHAALRDDRHIYIMFDSFSLLSLAPLVREVFDVKNLIVWDKVTLGMGHYYRRRHELILFSSKGKRRLATRRSPDVWAIRRIVRAPYPTQKPVELFTRMVTESAEPHCVVCDPFLGSGSAGVAALQAGCRFVGNDSSARACELAASRLEAILAGEDDPLEPASRKR